MKYSDNSGPQLCSGSTKNVFTDEYLSKIDVVVFLHSRGYDLSKEQMESFKKFIRNGGGFVGIHASSACKDQELWFQQLVGRVLTDHPEEQTAVLNVLDGYPFKPGQLRTTYTQRFPLCPYIVHNPGRRCPVLDG